MNVPKGGIVSKKRTIKDPHHEREAEKYEHPVPSREYIQSYLRKCENLVPYKKFLKDFHLKTEEEREGLRRRLRAMERDGQIIQNRRGAYGLVDEMELIPGRVQAHRDGFGFLIPDDGSSDIFLSARFMRGLFNDDRVLVRVSGTDSRKRREGAVVEVLERNTTQVVGKFILDGGISFIDPDSKKNHQDIFIPAENRGDAKHGQFVVAEITSQPTQRRQPVGRVIDILGDQLTPGMEVELAIRSHELPYIWPEAVLKEATDLPQTISSADLEGREDLRKLPFVTIDGEDAQDFDDAVYCESGPNGGCKLYVAIADVTHYVKPGTPLDEEAVKRGNSVYFPAKVIPMLPERLSNNLCSLRPCEDRLVMVCEMHIDKEGCVQDYEFHKAVIHSHARLTYTEVAEMLKRNKSEKYSDLFVHIKELDKLFKKLIKQRKLRGAIDFDMVETQVVFDDEGKIDKIIPRHRNEAHRIIEEAMLLANVCSADYLEKAEIKTLYRNHETPEAQKLQGLRDFMKPFGLRLGGGDKPTAKDYSHLLQRIEKRKDQLILQTVLLRSLRQAVYAPENKGHFGLSYEHYTHFTSPIRRYPDVLVHRAIKFLLKGKPAKKFMYDEEMVTDLGMHCSFTERRADYASRDALDWLKCEYMQDKVGQEFEGTISDVTGFGIFVKLKAVYVEGLVHISSLKNDYYHFDATHHVLRGKHADNSYRLGDDVRILVSRVDLDRREISFEIAE